MIYFVGGASRSGKTTIAAAILARRGIPYLSLDWLMMGFTNGIPEFGIHDKLFPDEIAERIWRFLNAMCESIIWTRTDCVIEGEALLPRHLEDLSREHPGEIRACFLGYSRIDVDRKARDVRRHSTGRGDWLIEQTDQEICQHILNMIAFSRKIEKACEQSNFRYFDTAEDFAGTVAEATSHLLDDAR